MPYLFSRSDIFLFPNFEKNSIRIKIYVECGGYRNRPPENVISDRLKKSEHRWVKFIELKVYRLKNDSQFLQSFRDYFLDYVLTAPTSWLTIEIYFPILLIFTLNRVYSYNFCHEICNTEKKMLDVLKSIQVYINA